MSYVKITIQGGGVVIKASDWELNMLLNSHHEEGQVLNLIRESSLKGLWAYLLGHTSRLFKYDDKFNVVESLFSDMAIDLLFSKSVIRVRRNAHASTFFARKDLRSTKSRFPSNSSFNLATATFDQADPTIRLLKEPLTKICKTESLHVVNQYFKNSKLISFESGVTPLPKFDELPGGKLKKAIEAYLTKKVVEKKLHSPACFELVGAISDLCRTNTSCKESIENTEHAKFSVFTSPTKTKHWVQPSLHTLVRGGPLFMVRLDFDIYAQDLPDTILVRLKNGPFIGRWGEGGIATLSLHQNENSPPDACSESEIPFVTFKDLRNWGVDLKKQSWENQPR